MLSRAPASPRRPSTDTAPPRALSTQKFSDSRSSGALLDARLPEFERSPKRPPARPREAQQPVLPSCRPTPLLPGAHLPHSMHAKSCAFSSQTISASCAASSPKPSPSRLCRWEVGRRIEPRGQPSAGAGSLLVGAASKQGAQNRRVYAKSKLYCDNPTVPLRIAYCVVRSVEPKTQGTKILGLNRRAQRR